MKKYSDILRKCPLFDGMKDEEIDLITERPGAVEKHCVRGETMPDVLPSDSTPGKMPGRHQ